MEIFCSTFTGKERDAETGYGYFGARYMDHELLTSWLSVDPMADKYPSISPYAYCAWNPVRLVDPDGKEIWIIGHKGDRIQYTPGMSTKGLKGFSKTTVNALNDIYGTEKGKELLDDLCGSSNTFNIVKSSSSKFKEFDRHKAYKIQYEKDPSCKNEYDYFDKSEFEGGSGGVIYWNNKGGRIPTTDGGVTNPIMDLAHEMFHAMDANRGLMDDRKENNVSRNDWQAVYNENILRHQMGQPLRTHYKEDIRSGIGIYIGGGGPSMLENGKPIAPWWL